MFLFVELAFENWHIRSCQINSSSNRLIQYNDRQEGRLVPLKLPTSLKSGNLTGKYITYQSTHILIYFVTNQQKEYMGFNMTWRALSLDLNDSTTASSSTVSSVSSSDGYTTVTSTTSK